MASLVYTAITSLDGYVNDATGRFDWAAPDDEVHAFVNDRERGVGTYLYGRGIYQTMAVWETMPTGVDQADVARDYARIWRAADKIVYSRTLADVSSSRTRLLRDFDVNEVRDLVDSADQDVSIGGPGLAGSALRAGIVDSVGLFLTPVIVGGGTHALPEGLLAHLRLEDVHRFDSGVVFVAYRVPK